MKKLKQPGYKVITERCIIISVLLIIIAERGKDNSKNDDRMLYYTML